VEDGNSVIRATRELIGSYARLAPSQDQHDRVMACWDVEERMAWGVRLFRGVAEVEARLQSHAFRGVTSCVDRVWAEIGQVYRMWTVASLKLLREAERLAHEGFSVEGLAEFRAILEQARDQLGRGDLEPELRLAEEGLALAKQENSPAVP
jgi:hypothetical protein